MEYEEMLGSAHLDIRERDLHSHDGLIFGRRIAINRRLTTKEKLCTLAEEVGHYQTSSGDILDQRLGINRKQELRARMYGYDRLIGLAGLVNAFEAGCQTRYEIADHLNITEQYLIDCLDAYRARYGVCIRHGQYVIYFVPRLIIGRSVTVDRAQKGVFYERRENENV